MRFAATRPAGAADLGDYPGGLPVVEGVNVLLSADDFSVDGSEVGEDAGDHSTPSASMRPSASVSVKPDQTAE